MESAQNKRISLFPVGTTVTVYNSDGFDFDLATGDLATIYNLDGSPLANPYTVTSPGEFFHRAAGGNYHVELSKADWNGGTPVWFYYHNHGGTPMPQSEAEGGVSTVFRLVSGQRIRQAIDAILVFGTTVFKGILSAFSEAQSTLVFTAGAVTLPVDTCDNIQVATITQNSAVTTSGASPTGKSIRIFITHTGGPWTLSWNGTDLGLEGAAGDLETIVATYNGAAWVFYRAGVADVVV